MANFTHIKVVSLFSGLFLMTSMAIGENDNIPPDVLNACSQCHEHTGSAAIPGWPPLNTMTKQQIVSKLKGHREQIIPDSTMSKVTFELTDQQIEDIADYYSAQDDISQQPIRVISPEK
mgnify:FL=1